MTEEPPKSYNGHIPPGRNGWHPIVTPPPHILSAPEWEKQYGESHQAFAAFATYRDMGPGRSIDVACRTLRERLGRPPGRRNAHANGRWKAWYTQWRWPDRADAWDRHIDQQTREAAEVVAREEGARLALQRSAQRATELELGDLLIQRARQMLTLPVIDQVVEQRDPNTGVPVVVTLKAAPKWSFRDAARFIDVAAQLKRLALDMETSRSSVTVDMEDEIRQIAMQYGFDAEVALEMAREFDKAAS